MIPEDSMSSAGFTILELHDKESIYILQKMIKDNFPCLPTEIHTLNLNDEERLKIVKCTKDKIVASQIVKSLLIKNADIFTTLLGPDIDIQSDVYLRVSRPNTEKDFIDWHRDTFYGNSFWELNLWIPIYPLAAGAGLTIIEGSHLEVPSNVKDVKDHNVFRSAVQKGSLANELGYLYAPKSDDTIANLTNKKVRLLAPKLGQAVLFFTNLVHRAQNASVQTRISIDVRIKNMWVPTNTKKGYYQPLTRGIISNCVNQLVEKGADR